MRLQLGSQLEWSFDTAVPLVLLLRPQLTPYQWVHAEEYWLDPIHPVREYHDVYGNRYQSLLAQPGTLRITTRATVETPDTVAAAPHATLTPIVDLPPNVLTFLLPSRYCHTDNTALNEQALRIVGDLPAGYPQVAAIHDWIHTHIKYQSGNSTSATTAYDTLQQGAGVCRDFAHMGIALCRTLNIPARMVAGYLHELEPMDQHAWFEAYLDGQWYTFDATQPTTQGGRVVVAYGRDAADIALATVFGAGTLHSFTVSVTAA